MCKMEQNSVSSLSCLYFACCQNVQLKTKPEHFEIKNVFIIPRSTVVENAQMHLHGNNINVTDSISVFME